MCLHQSVNIINAWYGVLFSQKHQTARVSPLSAIYPARPWAHIERTVRSLSKQGENI